jgi:hypothetical protein
MHNQFNSPGKATAVAVTFWLAGLLCYLTLLWAVSGFSFYASYDDLKSNAELYSSLPLIVQQLSHNVAGIFEIFKLALLILLYASWKERRYRWFIALWVVVEISVSVPVLGPKTPLLLFLVANVLLYHRFVQKLSLGKIAAMVVLLTCGALVLGFVRNYLGPADAQPDLPILSTSNEFQALFATGYDIAQRYAAGDLAVPWQIHIADFLRLVPQQLIPFEKIEPADWYLRLIGADGTGVGFMFGAIAESVVSGGWVGLAIRGGAVGVLFAFAHNWHSRRKQDFYVTLAYLWLCLHAYYCFRASMFYILAWAMYRLVPALALVVVSRNLLKATRISQERSPRIAT